MLATYSVRATVEAPATGSPFCRIGRLLRLTGRAIEGVVRRGGRPSRAAHSSQLCATPMRLTKVAEGRGRGHRVTRVISRSGQVKLGPARGQGHPTLALVLSWRATGRQGSCGRNGAQVGETLMKAIARMARRRRGCLPAGLKRRPGGQAISETI